MKLGKMIASVCACVIVVTLTACGAQPLQNNQESAPPRVAALKGPTALGMIKLIDEADLGSSSQAKYSIEVASSPDELVPKIAKGELDIAALPSNLASVLYNKTNGAVQVAAINTLGALYVCDTQGQIKNISDLAGKTIVASGKGAVPELLLNYVLKAYNLEDKVTVDWKSEHSECVAVLTQDSNTLALLPEPFVALAQAKNEQVQPVLDMNALWKSAQEKLGVTHGGDLVTGVLVVRKAFAEENPRAVEQFLSAYKESIDWVNNNNEAAAELTGKHGIIPAQVAKQALPQCNICYKTGPELKKDLSAYLDIMYTLKPEAIGGSLPKDDFYYGT